MNLLARLTKLEAASRPAVAPEATAAPPFDWDAYRDLWTEKMPRVLEIAHEVMGREAFVRQLGEYGVEAELAANVADLIER